MRTPRVLIIDDSRLMQMHIARVLQEAGMHTGTAENGEEGCKQVFAFLPDVILMDIAMPVMDGISAVRFLKSNRQTKHIPVVVFTSETDTDEKVRALEAGANDLISKEADEAELVVRVKNLIKLKELEDELLFERDKLGSILNDLAQAVVIVGTTGRVMLVNATARALLKIPPEIETDLNIGQLLATSPDAGEVARRLKENDVQEVTVHLDAADGRRVFQLRFSPIFLNDATRFGNALIFRDVTQEKEMEELKASFHSMIAHDLRSPITVITGYTDLLVNGKAGELNEMQVEFLRAVEERACAMRKLVDEFLLVSKFESSFIVLELKETDINAMIRDVAASLKLIAENKNISVHHDLDDTLPHLPGDPDKLYKVFSNLFDNALKYTPEGGSVTLRTCLVNDVVRVDVSDDGIGIDEEELSCVFDRYKRMSTAEKHKIKGTGLGLAIVKEIVVAHGGDVTVASAPGEGSTFSVELPLGVSTQVASETADTLEGNPVG